MSAACIWTNPRFEPFYAAVAAKGVPLVLHPTVPIWGETISDHSMIPMMGFMVDTSFAMLRLILGGVLERHPQMHVVHPHCGGVLPYLMGRVVEQTEVKRRGPRQYQAIAARLLSAGFSRFGVALAIGDSIRL